VKLNSAERLPRCSEVEAFAEKLIVALAPLMELIFQEFPPFQLRVDKVEFARGIVRELMKARFGRPSTDRADEYGFEIEYKCINEDGDEVEAGIRAFKEGHRLTMYANSYHERWDEIEDCCVDEEGEYA
jgi:hypothetical protein